MDQNKPIAVFSLEMSTRQLVKRLICSRAKIDLSKVRAGFLSDRDFQEMTRVGSNLNNSKMFIDDTSSLSILELRAKARRLKNQHGIEAIFIDYLQLLRSTTRRAQDNRQIEIAEISAGVQAKLLRLLQEREFSRLGSTRTLKTDARFVAATHRNLEQMAERGEFRQDLLYRLNVLSVWLPPLRARREDIAELAQHFLQLSPFVCLFYL